MKKLLTIFLSITLCIGALSAQTMDGNYSIDSLVVKYVMVTRSMEQVSPVDQQTYTSEFDANLSNYGLRVRFPSAADDEMEWEFELPLFEVGDTIRTTDVALPAPAYLQAGNISMNVDFDGTNGTYVFNEGSTYPTTQTVDCITSPVIPAVTDAGTWTDGDHGQDGAVITTKPTTVLTGWGIIRSGVFATFQAPNMATMALGVDYGMTPEGTETAMPNWGYMKATYNDDGSLPVGLNLGWEARDGRDANIGIVSAGDQYWNQTDEDLGLLNGVVGIGSLDIDSVTIGYSAAVAASGATITVPTPAGPHTYPNFAFENGITVSVPTTKAYMFNGPGAIDPTTGATVMDDSVNTTTGQTDTWPMGQFTGNKAYIFDPTGDLLGGGDGLPFSGDEALAFTGYYATWNTLQTLMAMTEGTTNAVVAAIYATDPPNPAALPTADSLAAYIIDAVLWQWDIDLPATVTGPLVATISAAFTAALTAELTEAQTTVPTLDMAKAAVSALLPHILGGLKAIEYGDATATLFVDSDGDDMTVDDSDWDVASEDWYWWDDSTDENGAALPYINADGSLNGTYYGGGRLFVELDANCIPARWSQKVDSHWSYTGALSTVDEGIIAEKFEIKGNYPNPFNPITKIRFSNDRTANVKVNIYSLLGERVNTLMNKQLNSGTYDVTWNGVNSKGKTVPSGMYLYEVESEGRRLQGKMLFLK